MIGEEVVRRYVVVDECFEDLKNLRGLGGKSRKVDHGTLRTREKAKEISGN